MIKALIDHLKCQASLLMSLPHHLRFSLQKFKNIILLSHREKCKEYPLKSTSLLNFLDAIQEGGLIPAELIDSRYFLTPGTPVFMVLRCKAEPETSLYPQQFLSSVMQCHACKDYDPEYQFLCGVCRDAEHPVRAQAPTPNLLSTFAVHCVDDLKEISPLPSGMSLVHVMITNLRCHVIGKCNSTEY